MANLNSLKMGHVNIRSLLPSKDSLSNIIDNLKLDILGVSETWLNRNIYEKDLSINGFKFYRQDRDTRGGGVGVYVRDDIAASKVDFGQTIECFEQIWVILHVGGLSVGLGNFYRPPKSNLFHSLEALERSVSTVIPLCDEVVCMGDMNVNLLNYNNSVGLLDNFLSSYSLSQVVRNPTRFCGDHASLIDLVILSNADLLVGEVKHYDMHELTDHQLIYCDLLCKVPQRPPKVVEFRNFKYFNFEGFNFDLINTDWREIFDFDCINKKAEILSNKVLRLFDIHAPLQKVFVTRPKSPWFTDVLKIMKKERNKLFSKYKKTKRQEDWEAYKTVRNLFTFSVRQEKKSYLEFVTRRNNCKETWRALNDLNIYSKAKNNVSIPSNLKEPDAINNFFVDSVTSLTTNVNNDFIALYQESRTNSVFHFSPFTELDVIKAISSLKSNACGVDGISTHMVRLCCPVIVPFLTHIFNNCTMRGMFPDNWRISVVIPLPKNNKVESLADLRPISLLCVFSKILEKLIHSQVSAYLNEFSLLSTTQSGFRKGYSTASILLRVMDDIFRAADKGETTALILLDYSKAFDTLDHKLLCAKLKTFGFSQESINFFNNYLLDRSQFVRLEGCQSGLRVLSRGVPQGSILGPLLFIIYTSDMDSLNMNCSIQRYADDTQLYTSFKKQEANEAVERLAQALELVANYSANSGLKLNPSKSAIIYFGPNREWASENLIVEVSQSVIQTVNECKNLGLLMDSDLRFRNQVSKIVQRSYASLRNLYKSGDVLGMQLKKVLCETLVLSHSIYCNFVYGPSLDMAAKQRLQRIQNSCIRFIYKIRARDHVRHKLPELKWLNIQDRETLHFACFLCKLLTHGVPEYLRVRLAFRSSTHDRATRHNFLLDVPKHRTAMFQRSFSYLASRMYNKLIYNKLENLSVVNFKIKLKEYLLGKYVQV